MSYIVIEREYDDLTFKAEVYIEPQRPAVLHGPNMGPAEGGAQVERLWAWIHPTTRVEAGAMVELSPSSFPDLCLDLSMEAEEEYYGGFDHDY